MQFELSLAGAGTASTRRMTTLHLMLAFVLCGLGAGCVVLYWFTAVSPKFTAPYRPFAVFGACSFLAGIVIAAVSVFYRNWLIKGKRNILLRMIEAALIGAGCLLFTIAGQKVPAVIFGIATAMIAVAAVWEARKPAKQTVTIDAAGISLPKGGISRMYRWSEIEQVMLRHSILSIELTGNRLIQRNIAADHTDIQSLEAFSADLIQQYADARAANAAW